MNRNQFCAYFDIPYMTVSDWEHGKKRVPKYFLRLLEYYVRTEQMKKGGEIDNDGEEQNYNSSGNTSNGNE